MTETNSLLKRDTHSLSPEVLEMRKHLSTITILARSIKIEEFEEFVFVMDTLRILGLTPEEIATELKTTPARVSDWFRGYNLPLPSDLQSTADSAYALLERTGTLFMGSRFLVIS